MILSYLLSYISMTVLMITGILMIIIILLQRGRGGGLAGAFGGLGGQSAFGTKAGDVFTKITVGLAVFWVILAGLSGLALERDARPSYVPDPGKEAIESRGAVGAGASAEKPLDETDGKGDAAGKDETTGDAAKKVEGTPAPGDEKSGASDKSAETKIVPPESTPDKAGTSNDAGDDAKSAPPAGDGKSADDSKPPSDSKPAGDAADDKAGEAPPPK